MSVICLFAVFFEGFDVQNSTKWKQIALPQLLCGNFPNVCYCPFASR